MGSYSHVGVIFDCDGTLIDSMEAWRALEEDLAARAGRPFTREDADALTVRTIPECGVYVHERFGLGERPADVERLINEFMMEFYATRSQLRPGALAFIEGLAGRDVRMTVASSTPQALLEAGLAHVGVTPYLDGIVSVDVVGKSKREPAVYDHARAIMGTTLEHTWGFEDALYAVETLARAGYRTVGIYDNDLSATYEQLAAAATLAIRCFADLPVSRFLELAEQRWGRMRARLVP